MNDATSVATAPDIHPEIPKPSWATRRYEDDGGLLLVHEHAFESDGYNVRLHQLHSFTPDGPRECAENALIDWDNHWPGEGVDHECMTVLIDDIPRLIKTLQATLEAAKGESGVQPRTVRRSPEVNDRLRNLDD